jgi:hypothetical protein
LDVFYRPRGTGLGVILVNKNMLMSVWGYPGKLVFEVYYLLLNIYGEFVECLCGALW